MKFRLPNIIRQCPLCGNGTLEVPRHRNGAPFPAQEDGFIVRCHSAGLSAKAIANLIGANVKSIQRRLRAMSAATHHE